MQDKKTKKSTQPNLEIDALKKAVEECNGKYLRALADYQNFENRVREEKTELIKTANKQFILKLLPFLDNLNKAEIFLKDSGLNMIKNNFLDILKEEGIEEIDIVGKEFDPTIAEAVDIGEGEQDNLVLEVLRKGYTFQGKVLRIAQVKVSKKITN